MKNYYKLLEVPNDADISTLRSAFRKKAKSCHPDLFQNVSEQELKKQQKMFNILSNFKQLIVCMHGSSVHMAIKKLAYDPCFVLYSIFYHQLEIYLHLLKSLHNSN